MQGVGYRFTAMEMAYRYGIRGFVKNKGSDSVYIDAEGNRENLENFLLWCKKGPMGAKVEKVAYNEAPLYHFKSFEIVSRDYEVK